MKLFGVLPFDFAFCEAFIGFAMGNVWAGKLDTV